MLRRLRVASRGFSFARSHRACADEAGEYIDEEEALARLRGRVHQASAAFTRACSAYRRAVTRGLRAADDVAPRDAAMLLAEVPDDVLAADLERFNLALYPRTQHSSGANSVINRTRVQLAQAYRALMAELIASRGARKFNWKNVYRAMDNAAGGGKCTAASNMTQNYANLYLIPYARAHPADAAVAAAAAALLVAPEAEEEAAAQMEEEIEAAPSTPLWEGQPAAAEEAVELLKDSAAALAAFAELNEEVGAALAAHDAAAADAALHQLDSEDEVQILGTYTAAGDEAIMLA